MKKIVCVSDTHREFKKLKIPEGDIFIHCGDLDAYEFSSELKKFNKWLATVPCKHKIIVAGNHDGYISRAGKKKTQEVLSNGIYLENSGVEIEGIKFWGSPYTPIFLKWYFMLPSMLLRELWEQIPKDTNILITHGPPFSIFDEIYKANGDFSKNAGCWNLHDVVFNKLPKLKYHLFGHIHSGYGVKKINNITFCNCSVMDKDYNLSNEPIVIDYQ